ncbi:MAG: hypothetical protein OMM_05637 [Candidatus Magnetoglobus multicellularis str. Araruama]|uniref:Uncharacterized protein n=1 Tax=Candidatus Magnetoglobus multicellularis str. Araruama TaxID=890399 RepID=A0A1V1NVF2_9BACT|nr:MAG: hypothetical protein OMM_05637 [Candidatus Magnetoglobus multicellularis str. Araruama]
MKKEDTFVNYNKYFYLTYNPENSEISSQIEICDENFKIEDFALIEGIPYVLLRSREEYGEIYFSYKNDNDAFQNPIIIENENIPKIFNTTLKDNNTYELNDFCRFIYHDGYIYDLNFRYLLTRYSFSEGSIGQPEDIDIQGNTENIRFESLWIEPVSDNDVIYFISPIDSKLVSINTNTFNIQSYSLPFTLGSDKEIAYKTSLVACNSIPYIFAEGKVFTIENNSIVPLSTISYTFGSDTVDYSTFWDEVSYIKSFRDKNTNKFGF